MKLSKQERIGALIILAIVIVAVGVFLLIKPKFEEVGRTQATLEQRKKELATKQERQKLKGSLRTEIEKEYEEGEHLADMFFPELTSYDADNAFRAFIKQLDIPVVVEQVTVAEPTTETLNVSFYTPTSVSYALKTYATQGVEQSEEEARFAQRNQALRTALNSAQTVGASKVTFTVSALSRDDILAFVDAVNDYKVKEGDSSEETRKAISITALNVDYSDVNQIYNLAVEASTEEIAREGRALLRELGVEVKDDNTASENPPEEEEVEIKIPYLVSYTDTLTFLSIERMQNPKATLDAQDGKTE